MPCAFFSTLIPCFASCGSRESNDCGVGGSLETFSMNHRCQFPSGGGASSGLGAGVLAPGAVGAAGAGAGAKGSRGVLTGSTSCVGGRLAPSPPSPNAKGSRRGCVGWVKAGDGAGASNGVSTCVLQIGVSAC